MLLYMGICKKKGLPRERIHKEEAHWERIENDFLTYLSKAWSFRNSLPVTDPI
jgi:hypothetical protein